jgi:hypothetical protein
LFNRYLQSSARQTGSLGFVAAAGHVDPENGRRNDFLQSPDLAQQLAGH